MPITSPAIQSVGSPPDRHAERVVDEMLRFLHRERPKLEAKAEAMLDNNQMGTPAGQRRVVARMRQALGSLALDIRLKPAKRGKYTLLLVDWTVWDATQDIEADSNKPPPPTAWLAAIASVYTGANYIPVVKSGERLLLTRHSMVRLAQRADVRTVDDLLDALRNLWSGMWRLVESKGTVGWLEPPNGAWFIPSIGDGPVAVLEPDSGGKKRLVVKTLLDRCMVPGIELIDQQWTELRKQPLYGETFL